MSAPIAADGGNFLARQAQSAGASPLFRRLVRAGFIARGLTYGVIGVLAFALAVGAADGAATDQEGALHFVDRGVLGEAAMVWVCAGLGAYALWKLGVALFRRGPEGAGCGSAWDRIASAAAGISYLLFFALALGVLVGRSRPPGPRQAAGDVLAWPAGRELVAAAGAMLIVVCIFQAWEGMTGRFIKEQKTDEMEGETRIVIEILGRIGLPVRAMVFMLIGWFLLRTAIDIDANKAVGIDGALRSLLAHPYGHWLLGFTAAGLMVFALFSFAEARYRRL